MTLTPRCRGFESLLGHRCPSYLTVSVPCIPACAPLAVIGIVQATRSVETLERLIGPPTLRVFCRFAFGRFYAVTLVGLLLELLLPPQATTNRLVAMSSPTPAATLPTRIVLGARAFIIAVPFDSASGL